MSDTINLEIKGLDKLTAALKAFPQKAERYLEMAGRQAAEDEIFPTNGLRTYPPATDANYPPTPYYIRGRGMQRAGVRKPEYNDYRSERLGTQWYTKQEGGTTYIGNRASYAPYVHGEEQAAKMGAKGWRKLLDVANEKIDRITKVYQAWIDKLVRDLGL